MKKKDYMIPTVQCVQVQVISMLADSTEVFKFDPGDDTSESLTKGQRGYNVWDDDWSQYQE